MSDVFPTLRDIPAVGRVLGWPSLQRAIDAFGADTVATAIRQVTDDIRQEIRDGFAPDLGEESVVQAIFDRLQTRAESRFKRVINATGVVLNTNLGRAPLPYGALERLMTLASGYCNLEYDLETGQRGSRQVLVQSLLTELTGAEGALVVNNNAAALLLALSSLAPGQEVVVSRGELIEIGGSFRLPDVIAQGGARLVEVGTTNRTRLADYERAVTDQTALFLKCHTSNFRQIGFTQAVAGDELAQSAHRLGLIAIEDLGSGLLLPLSGIEEPTVPQVVASGLDLVTFSGDKLLGGPQAGLVVGRAHLIEKMAKHPLMRALRPDKLTLVALEATLQYYRDPVIALKLIPTLAALSQEPEILRERAEHLADALAHVIGGEASISVEKGHSQSGGGSLPETPLATFLVALRPHHVSIDTLHYQLRHGEPPVVARRGDGALLLDPRTLLKGEDLVLAEAVQRALMVASCLREPS